MPDNQQGCKITLYWLDKSRAQRIVWLFEELKLDYELKIFKRGSNFLAPSELKEIHPLGKSPVVTVLPLGAEKPVVLAESGVIVEYLLEHFGRSLLPQRFPEGREGVVGAETEDWLRYQYLMHYAEGSLMPFMLLAMIVRNIEKAPVWFFVKPVTRGIAGKINASFLNPNLKVHVDFLEQYLADSPSKGEYFGSKLSGPDFMMIYPLEAAIARVPLDEATHPSLVGWVKRMQAREAYVKAGERVSEASGDKYVPVSQAKL